MSAPAADSRLRLSLQDEGAAVLHALVPVDDGAAQLLVLPPDPIELTLAGVTGFAFTAAHAARFTQKGRPFQLVMRRASAGSGAFASGTRNGGKIRVITSRPSNVATGEHVIHLQHLRPESKYEVTGAVDLLGEVGVLLWRNPPPGRPWWSTQQ